PAVDAAAPGDTLQVIPGGPFDGGVSEAADDAGLGSAPTSPAPTPGTDGSDADAEPGDAGEGEPRGATHILLQTILGLLALLALAWLAGNPRVRHLEEVLGLSRVVAAGFPFIAL